MFAHPQPIRRRDYPPQNMDQKTIDTYNKLAQEYDAETVDFWNNFPRTIIEKFTENIGTGRILDVGSGPGRGGLIFKNMGFSVVCLDASSEMVKLSRDRGLESVEADFEEMPFGDNEFDGVWAYTSLLHIPKSKINLAITEIKRVLKPDGILGLGLIEGDVELYRESSGVNMPRWFSFYTKEELEKILNENNFEILYFEQFKPNSKNYLNFITRKSI